MSIELLDRTVSSTSGCRDWIALAISAAIGSADGMTPTDRCPRKAPCCVPTLRDVLLQRRPVVEDGVRPLQHAFAVWREADEPLATLDDGHAELLLELPEAPRQRGLRHVTGLGRAREMLLAGEGDQILELTDIHAEASGFRLPDWRPPDALESTLVQ